jgi:hypothetical protein
LKNIILICIKELACVSLIFSLSNDCLSRNFSREYFNKVKQS